MYGFFAKAIVFFYDLWPSYGGAIILLTLAIMVVLLPLTLKGTRSMIAMQRLQPELKKLQSRYKDDRAKLNEEMLKFYKENKINPLGGCLPLLIQLPVFWVLYEVLLGLTRHGPFGADLASGMACSFGNAAKACQGGVYQLAGTFSPSYIHQDSTLWQALHGSRRMMSFGIDLSQSPLTALGGGVLHALPYLAMILVVVATTYIQQKQVQGRTTQASVNPQQQMMMKVMPVAFAVIYVIIPAGVVVYFLVSNVFRIAQQGFITRSMYGPGSGVILTTATDTSSKKTQPERNWLLSMLVPSRASLPQVGKKAQARGDSGGSGGSGGSGKRGGGSATATKTAPAGGKKGKGGKGTTTRQVNGSRAVKGAVGERNGTEPPGSDRARADNNGVAEGPEVTAASDDTRPRAPARKGATAPARRPQGPARQGPPPPNRARNKKKRK